MKKQVHVYYEGSVQGVGFRYTAEHIARGLSLAGWVKNLPDDHVELIAEGEEKALTDLLARIKQHMGRYIRNDVTEWSAYKGEYKDFEIKF